MLFVSLDTFLICKILKKNINVGTSGRLSVRTSVHPSIRLSALRFNSLPCAVFNQFSSNLVHELILGRSVLGLQMGKFRQISTELWPLIDVRNWFSFSIFGISYRFSSNFARELILGRCILGLKMG